MPARKSVQQRKSPSSDGRAARWETEFRRVRSRLETVWTRGRETVWQQAAVAALQWIAAHQSRVDALREAVHGTRAEEMLDRALSAIQAEAGGQVAVAAVPARRRKPKPRKAGARTATARKATARTRTVAKATRPRAQAKPQPAT